MPPSHSCRAGPRAKEGQLVTNRFIVSAIVLNRLAFSAALLLFAVAAFGEITGEHPVSTPVNAPVTAALEPAVASDGDGFLAVWCDQRDHGAIYATRIARGGTILDPRGILLANTISHVAVAWTGDRYLVAWNGINVIMAQEIAADGRFLTQDRVIVHGAQITSAPHPIASNGRVTVLMTSSGYSVLDREANVIEQGRFGESAYITGSGQFVLPAAGSTRLLDSSGHYVTSVARTWRQVIACHGNGCITAFPFGTKAGVATYDPAGLAAGPAMNLPIATRTLDIVPTTDGYLLVTDSVAQRLDDNGHPVGTPTALPAADSYVQAASNGRDVAVLRWSFESFTALVISPTAVTKPEPVTTSANAQRDVAIAASGTNYLTVWTEKDGAYAGRLSLDGLPLDGRGVFLGQSSAKPSVVFDGTSYLVVLQQRSISDPEERVLRIEPATGAVMSISTIDGTDLRIGANGSTRVAVWVDTLGAVETAFLTPTGALASIPVFLAVQPSGQPLTTFANLSLAWNGTIWLATWEEQAHYQPVGAPPPLFPGIPPAIAIRGVRLSAALTPLDTHPITVALAPAGNIRSSRAASDGRDFLVAWTTDRVRVRRVLSSGALDEEMPFFTGSVQDLVWDGVAYDLAFATARWRFSPGDMDVAQLRSSGQPFQTLVISPNSGGDRTASLLTTSNGHILAAYTRAADELLYAGVARAFVAAPHPIRERPVSKENP